MSDDLLLDVRDLSMSYSPRRALRHAVEAESFAVKNLSFQVEKGTTVGLVGESGSGKSTTAFCIARLLRPTSGQILFDGTDLTAASGGTLRAARRNLQMVFQDPYSSLHPRMRVLEIIEEPLRAYGVGTRQSRRTQVMTILEQVGLSSAHANRRPHEFSGGQRQRIAIGRALALRPKLIVCDEAVSALDVSVQAQIMNLLKDLQDEFGLSYIFIGHDLAVVRAVSDQIVVMKDGVAVETGPVESVLGSPKEDYTKKLIAAIPRAPAATDGSLEPAKPWRPE
jgi:ABC-type glutathione transport system ATPase component